MKTAWSSCPRRESNTFPPSAKHVPRAGTSEEVLRGVSRGEPSEDRASTNETPLEAALVRGARTWTKPEYLASNSTYIDIREAHDGFVHIARQARAVTHAAAHVFSALQPQRNRRADRAVDHRGPHPNPRWLLATQHDAQRFRPRTLVWRRPFLVHQPATRGPPTSRRGWLRRIRVAPRRPRTRQLGQRRQRSCYCGCQPLGKPPRLPSRRLPKHGRQRPLRCRGRTSGNADPARNPTSSSEKRRRCSEPRQPSHDPCASTFAPRRKGPHRHSGPLSQTSCRHRRASAGQRPRVYSAVKRATVLRSCYLTASGPCSGIGWPEHEGPSPYARWSAYRSCVRGWSSDRPRLTVSIRSGRSGRSPA